MKSVSRRALIIGAAALAVAGCTTPPAPTSAPAALAPVQVTSATPEPEQPPTPAGPPVWPLTGLPLKDPAQAAHAAIAVKVPDNRNEHPQSGIDKADIVFVELDGYPAAIGQSGTRLVPVFHSAMAPDVGPVRSIRPVDVALLSPIHAIIGNTGGARWTLNYFAQNAPALTYDLSYMKTKGTGAYGIDSSRVYTLRGHKYYDHAVICHPEILAKQTSQTTAPPVPYFPFAASPDEVSTTVAGKPAKHVAVPWKKGHSYDMTYDYDKKSGRYLRSMPWGKHVLKDGTRVATDNVLVILANQHFAHHEPFHDITGKSGTFYYAHGGAYVTGTWSKGDPETPFVFTLADGSPLQMAPGKTFVELPNVGAKVVFSG